MRRWRWQSSRTASSFRQVPLWLRSEPGYWRARKSATYRRDGDNDPVGSSWPPSVVSAIKMAGACPIPPLLSALDLFDPLHLDEPLCPHVSPAHREARRLHPDGRHGRQVPPDDHLPDQALAGLAAVDYL